MAAGATFEPYRANNLGRLVGKHGHGLHHDPSQRVFASSKLLNLFGMTRLTGVRSG